MTNSTILRLSSDDWRSQEYDLGALRVFFLTTVLLAALVLTACSDLLGDTPAETNGSADDAATTTGETDCLRQSEATTEIDTGTNSRDALAIAGKLFVCAQHVVIVVEDDLNQVAVAAQLAAALGGPLFFPDDRLPAELGRLHPEHIHVVGELQITTPPESELLTLTMAEAVQAAADALGVTQTVTLPATPSATSIIEAVAAINARDRVITAETATGSPSIDMRALIDGLNPPAEAAEVWITDASDPTGVLLSAASGRAVGAATVAMDPSNALEDQTIGQILRSTTAASRLIGLSEIDEWELALLKGGRELPGGGFLILPEAQRRYVAFYGHPETTALGVLGEQDGEGTIERMRPFLEDYAADGALVIPTFEIIATVASAGAGNDGNYSFEWPAETFDDLFEAAERHDAYILLDLQPGRADFLTQAKFYENLLLRPNVGLALDPEWRLGPDQIHLEQIGTVDAAEVNTVIEWLAALTRENELPQKMLLLHMFTPSMITNRDLLEDRPELQIVIQMDGDGREVDKDRTWSRLREGFEDAFWAWGWKNFFDEDEPGPPTPLSTISKQPTPVYVSYQ